MVKYLPDTGSRRESGRRYYRFEKSRLNSLVDFVVSISMSPNLTMDDIFATNRVEPIGGDHHP